MNVRYSSGAVRAILCFGLLALSAFAQSERGSITGAVHDTSGAVVPGASIKITNEATNVHAGHGH